MGDFVQSLLEDELSAAEHFLVCIPTPMTNHAIVEGGNGKHGMGRRLSSLQGFDVVAGGPVARLTLNALLLAECGIELPRLGVGGGCVASEANGAFPRLNVHPRDFGDLERLGKAQCCISLSVPGEPPEAVLVAGLLSPMTRNAGAHTHIKGGPWPLR